MYLYLIQISPRMITNIVLALGFIVVLMGVLLLIILVFSRRKQNELYINQQKMAAQFQSELLQSRIEVQEDTFRHIGKELHDNIGQLLSSTKMLIGLTERTMGEVPETLTTANETVSQAILEVRNLSRSLDKEWLEQFDFLDNLQRELKRVNAGNLIQTQLHAEGNLKMKTNEQIVLYRMIQEAVQNAIRHAEPSRIDVHIESGESEILVRIVNDGKPLPANFSGMGTNNMKHRASLFGGSVQWTAGTSETEVIIHLPIKEQL